MAVATAIAIGGMIMQASGQKKAAKAQRDANDLAAQQAADQLAFQKEQMALLEEQKQRYRDFEFTNPYADMVNPYADIQNPYEGMENAFEDLTVDQQAARFQMEQGAQQRANIMQQMTGAAGGSGIAGLAQALAGQGTLQARQVSADISQQERANRMAAAQGAQQVQTLQRQGAFQADQLRMQGASAADMAQRGGAAMIQEAEMQRQSTLLGVAYQGAAGAQAGLQQAYSNQMSMNMAGAQMQMQNAAAWGNMAGTAMGSEGFWNNI